jgi:hypothetical protein
MLGLEDVTRYDQVLNLLMDHVLADGMNLVRQIHNPLVDPVDRGAGAELSEVRIT